MTYGEADVLRAVEAMTDGEVFAAADICVGAFELTRIAEISSASHQMPQGTPQFD